MLLAIQRQSPKNQEGAKYLFAKILYHKHIDIRKYNCKLYICAKAEKLIHNHLGIRSSVTELNQDHLKTA